MRVFANLDAVRRALGDTLGPSDWVTIDQAMIDRFAEATGDFQWIHVDRERAAASPLGSTIAHGFLTLSLLPRLGNEVYRVDGIAARLNYGCNKVRFTAPVKAGQRVRASFKFIAAEDAPQGLRLTIAATVELEGSAKPACVAEQIALLIKAEGAQA
ncbi:MAG TPA: MaoC family dehydratase [Stellaceae bacterium]|nr:MaoC family dehydratase [Stellaceae bacterium]